MNILEKMQALQSFAKDFIKRKVYLENLNSYMIDNQVKECDRLAQAVLFAQNNYDDAARKLEKYQNDRAVLETWIPEHAAEYAASELANSDKLQKLASKVQSQLDELSKD